MVIGNGLIAKAFKAKYENDDEWLIFASGVSNSSCTDQHEFDKEISLLEQALTNHNNKHFVYFSTCSFYDTSIVNSQYLIHKRKAETLIAERSNVYTIFRVPNLVGHTNNPHTVLNYFYNCICQHIPFQVWDKSCRNFLDIDDLFMLSDAILQEDQLKNKIINIASPVYYPIVQVVETLSNYCHIPAVYTKIDKGVCFEIDIKEWQHHIHICEGIDQPSYLHKLLCKYYLAASI